MATFGLIALATGIAALRSQPASRLALGLTGLFFLFYGLWALLVTGFEPHFLLFAGFGVGIGLSALPLAKRAD